MEYSVELMKKAFDIMLKVHIEREFNNRDYYFFNCGGRDYEFRKIIFFNSEDVMRGRPYCYSSRKFFLDTKSNSYFGRIASLHFDSDSKMNYLSKIIEPEYFLIVHNDTLKAIELYGERALEVIAKGL